MMSKRNAAPTPIYAKNWTPDQRAVQLWLATPPAARQPRSQRALAAQLELHELTLTAWKRLPGFAEAVYGLVLEHVKGDLAAILHAQVKAARKGSLAHAAWLFEVCGIWTPRSKHEHSGAGGGPLRIVIETVPDRSPQDALTLAP